MFARGAAMAQAAVSEERRREFSLIGHQAPVWPSAGHFAGRGETVGKSSPLGSIRERPFVKGYCLFELRIRVLQITLGKAELR